MCALITFKKSQRNEHNNKKKIIVKKSDNTASDLKQPAKRASHNDEKATVNKMNAKQ